MIKLNAILYLRVTAAQRYLVNVNTNKQNSSVNRLLY